jgi:uncharacterized protein YdhG (YjbR/CyaY superfamily)
MVNDIFKDYLAKTNETQKRHLERIIAIVKDIVPNANEVISYGIPGFKYKGQYLLGFAVFKNHMSLFPTSGPIENLKDKLKGFKTARGTIQFSDDNPLPEHLLKEIIENRLRGITK